MRREESVIRRLSTVMGFYGICVLKVRWKVEVQARQGKKEKNFMICMNNILVFGGLNRYSMGDLDHADDIGCAKSVCLLSHVCRSETYFTNHLLIPFPTSFIWPRPSASKINGKNIFESKQERRRVNEKWGVMKQFLSIKQVLIRVSLYFAIIISLHFFVFIITIYNTNHHKFWIF